MTRKSRSSRRVGGGGRAQAFTLEAFSASLLLIGSILFALQVTAVTPLTSSTASQHLENQQQQVAAGLLDTAVSNGSLRESLLYWNDTGGRFYGADSDEGVYTIGGPPTTFGAMLNRTFRGRGVAFNVNLWYVTTADSVRREQLVNFGTPSDNAVSARRTITLYDDDELTAPGFSEELTETSNYFTRDIAPNSGVYTIVRVEVVVWRM